MLSLPAARYQYFEKAFSITGRNVAAREIKRMWGA
jgi:hypothetical protein